MPHGGVPGVGCNEGVSFHQSGGTLSVGQWSECVIQLFSYSVYQFVNQSVSQLIS